MRRFVVAALARLDLAIDAVLYRPAMVKAFLWLPRWWLCDLAKLSARLDERWRTDYWANGMVPQGRCEACGRRAAWAEIGGRDPENPDPTPAFLDDRTVGLCGWCQVRGPITNPSELAQELEAARRASISWRWRAGLRGARTRLCSDADKSFPQRGPLTWLQDSPKSNTSAASRPWRLAYGTKPARKGGSPTRRTPRT